MSNTVIKVENLSKLYRLGEVGTGTISHDLNRWLAKIRGKDDPFAIVGQVNDRTKIAESDYVWALKDVNFEVKQGEVLGIIGKNGAGKSTLLKLLSQITSPTTGEIKVKGRIAALLEVGTGMHPEMTARENIFLNGAIMGMRKHEIKVKFDEIIDFAGCAMYVDTPIKRFSSGMRVRLGFAVAAFLEPEILIVDEVLAVGDAEFQRKAIGKMKQVSESEGRTVLFVSHNMGAIKNLCTSGMVIKNGGVNFLGNIKEAVDNYLTTNVSENRKRNWTLNNAPGNDFIKILSAEVQCPEKDIDSIIEEGDSICLKFVFENLIIGETQLDVTFHLYDEMNTIVFTGSTGRTVNELKLQQGTIEVECLIPKHLMNEGNYRIGALLFVKNRGTLLYGHEDILAFDIHRKNRGLGWQGKKEGVVRPVLNWKVNQNEL